MVGWRIGREGFAGRVFVNSGAAAREIFLVAIFQLTTLWKMSCVDVLKKAKFGINVTELFVIAKS